MCWIFKFICYFKGLYVLGKILYVSVNELIMLMFFLVIGVVLFVSVVYYVEEEINYEEFFSIFVVFWWVVVIMIMVGYGDVLFKIILGKLCFFKFFFMKFLII